MITPKIPNTQESIKIIKEAQGWLSLNESYGDTYITIDQPLSAALVQAIIALQKQIPVPPILIDQTVESYANVQCPSCNRKFQIGKVSKMDKLPNCSNCGMVINDVAQNFCGYCQKAIDWSNKE